MDYPTLKKFCVTNKDVKNFCKVPDIQNLLIEKEFEYVENNLEYLMSKDKLDKPLADLFEFLNSSFEHNDYETARIIYDRFTKILSNIPGDYPIINRFTPFETVIDELNLIVNLGGSRPGRKIITEIPGCYIKATFLPKLSRELETIVFVKEMSSECEKIYSMSASSIKDLMVEEEKILAKNIAKRRGPKARPNKEDMLSAILQTRKVLFDSEEKQSISASSIKDLMVEEEKILAKNIAKRRGPKAKPNKEDMLSAIVENYKVQNYKMLFFNDDLKLLDDYVLYKLDKQEVYNVLSILTLKLPFKYSNVKYEQLLSKYNMLQVFLPFFFKRLSLLENLEHGGILGRIQGPKGLYEKMMKRKLE